MLQNTLQDKIGIITAAADGIGRAIAETAMEEGARLILNDIDGPRLSGYFQSERYAYRHQNICLPGDAGDLQHIENLVNLAISQFGRIDFVIANAGITEFGDFFDFTPEQFQSVIRLNMQGTFFLVQAVARNMRRQKTGGRIILISSVLGQRAYPGLTAYAMTKAALIMMAKNLVSELSRHQISINCIAPGATITPRTALEEENYIEAWSELIPLGKVCDPLDIAKTALFLLSDASGHITGQTLTVDGGWTAVSYLPESKIMNDEIL